MTVQLSISYETLIDLVAQLTPDERQALLHRLRESEQAPLTDTEWQTAFRALVIDAPLGGPIPLRRAEWYDDDGR